MFTLSDISFQQQDFGGASIDKEYSQLYFDNSEENTNINENRPHTGTRPGTATTDAKKRMLIMQKERLLNEQKKRFSQQG